VSLVPAPGKDAVPTSSKALPGAPASEVQGFYSVLVGPGCILEPRALEQLAHSIGSSGADALACWGGVRAGLNGQETLPYRPLGACLEGGFLTNYFGGGCVILKTKYLPRDLEGSAALLAPEQMWRLLVELAVAGKDCDVIPERLMTLPRTAAPLSCSDLDYQSLFRLVQAYSNHLPGWWHQALINAIESEVRLQGLNRRIAVLEKENHLLGRTSVVGIASRAKREAGRLTKRVRKLFQRE
jgi:hypothetical protein